MGVYAIKPVCGGGYKASVGGGGEGGTKPVCVGGYKASVWGGARGVQSQCAQPCQQQPRAMVIGSSNARSATSGLVH